MTTCIRNGLRQIGIGIITSALLFSGSLLVAYAQTGPNPPGNPSGPNPPSAPTQSLMNPLRASTIQEFLLQIIQILIVFATPVIVVFIMYAGFLFVTARGNESQISDAKHALTWAVVGGVVLLGAQMIITVIQSTVTALRAP